MNTLPPFGESIKWLLGVPSIASGIVSTLVGMFAWRYNLAPAVDAWVFTFVILLAFFFGAVLWIFYRRVIIGELEVWTRQDLNRNGHIGHDDDRLPLQDMNQNEQPRNWAGLPTDEPTMVKVAYAMLSGGRPFSERQMKEIVSSDTFRELQDELVRRNWMVYRSKRDNRQGCDLTPHGQNIFWRLLDKHGLIDHSTTRQVQEQA